MSDTTDQAVTATDHSRGARGELAAAPADQLVLAWWKRGERAGERALLSGGEVIIGRALYLFPHGPLADDELLSRRHALLRREGGRWSIEDLGSRNGTWVNGVRLEGKRALADGDLIRAGELLAVYRCEAVPAPCPAPAEFLGISGAAVGARGLIAALGAAEAPVLLQGESGTGKEVAAQALHRLSGRRGQLVAVDCPSIPESLWESEMFGHERGAFSGAQGMRPGRIEQADGGTLFLDEIGELPLAMQPKLLRVLEGRMVSRLWAGRPVPVAVRLVAATNRDLAGEVAAGRFRSDLFARVAHAVITLPPLRERRCDVPLLLAHFLARQGISEALPPADLELLMLHPWPLNVRELASLAELIALSQRSGGGPLGLDGAARERLATYARSVGPGLGPALAADGRGALAPGRGSRESKAAGGAVEGGEELSRELLERLLADCRGNVTLVSERLGKHRFQLYRLLERFGLDPKRYR